MRRLLLRLGYISLLLSSYSFSQHKFTLKSNRESVTRNHLIHFCQLSTANMSTEQSKNTLRRLLSTCGANSTSSARTEQIECALADKLARQYRHIGRGTCGVVFHQAGTTCALKQALPDFDNQLWNDYYMHTRVLESFQNVAALSIDIKIPRA